MGHHKARYLAKLRQQLINSQENKIYYQNGSEQKNARSESRIKRDRELNGPE